MVFWGQIRVDKTKLEQIITLPNFNFGQLLSNAQTDLNLTYLTFGQLFMWIGANNGQI